MAFIFPQMSIGSKPAMAVTIRFFFVVRGFISFDTNRIRALSEADFFHCPFTLNPFSIHYKKIILVCELPVFSAFPMTIPDDNPADFVFSAYRRNSRDKNIIIVTAHIRCIDHYAYFGISFEFRHNIIRLLGPKWGAKEVSGPDLICESGNTGEVPIKCRRVILFRYDASSLDVAAIPPQMLKFVILRRGIRKKILQKIFRILADILALQGGFVAKWLCLRDLRGEPDTSGWASKATG
jgi:hypothetical protein